MGCTVKELIEKLQTFPPDAPVCYRCYSEFSWLELEQVILHQGESGAMIVRSGNGPMATNPNWCLKGAQEEYITCVAFPGN